MAIDALQFRSFLEQFRPDKINRELNKVIFCLCSSAHFLSALFCFLMLVTSLFALLNVQEWVVPSAVLDLEKGVLVVGFAQI